MMSVVLGGVLPGGFGADVWTFVTYSLLHGSWMHLGVNGVWLLAFGSAVARRFGVLRFLSFFAVTAAAGAAMHLLTNAGLAGADDRRVGGDLRRDGGGDAFCLSARRPAWLAARR